MRAGLIGDPAELTLRTIIDGEVRQQEQVSDLLFDCAYLVSYLSTGTTLRKGSVIMTGTPGGRSCFLSPAMIERERERESLLTLVRCWFWLETAEIFSPGDDDGGGH